MITNIIALTWLHFIADFALQTDKIAVAKSRDLKALCLHCGIYSIPLLFFGWRFAFLNGLLHFIVDFVTSKITRYYWSNKNRHWFFMTIGCDQAIHITTLILTLVLLR